MGVSGRAVGLVGEGGAQRARAARVVSDPTAAGERAAGVSRPWGQVPGVAPGGTAAAPARGRPWC